MNILITDCFDTWEHRADLLLKVLAEEGHRVQVLMSDFRHIEKSRRFDRKDNFIFFTAEPYKKNISIERLYSHTQLSIDMFSWVEEHERKIDILWVLAPPNSFVKNAAEIKQKHNHIKLVIDLIDLWPETMPMGGFKHTPAFYMWRMIRDGNLKYADVIITECNLYRKALGRVLDGKRVETLYLARKDTGYEPHLNLPDNQINLCYLGSINNIIDIDTIGKIIEKCGKIRPVKLIIAGHGEKKHELCSTAKAAGAKVDFRGTVYDRGEKQRIFDSCHYGLNIMKDSVCVGLTMKSIDYFESGLPIINNIKGDTWDVIEKYGCGMNIDKEINIGNKNYFLNEKWHIDRRENSRAFFEEYLTEDVFRKKMMRLL